LILSKKIRIGLR